MKNKKIKIKTTFEIDLSEFRYSLVGDGYLLKEVESKSDKDLIEIFKQKYIEKIPIKIHKNFISARDMGLLYDNEDDDEQNSKFII